MKTYSELKKQHLLKQITEEEYQKEKADLIGGIVKHLTANFGDNKQQK